MTQPQRNFDGVYRPSTPHINIRTEQGPVSSGFRIIPPKKPRRRWKILLWIIVILGVSGVGFVGVRSLALSNKVFVGEKPSLLQQVTDVIRGGGGNLTLEGEKDGQINILLLGIGGEGHDGPYLSDTIILAQIRPEQKQVSMVSIPRDYYSNIPGIGYRKINAAFAEGYYRTKSWDEAGKIARETVQKLSGLTIPYFAVIDFNGFEQAIDKVGGVDVQIDRTFTDYQYPNETNGYLPPQTFKEGPEHMNGKRALIFSRSRHAAGPEGSDFARGQRQHKIIQSFKSKATSLNLITDIGAINGLVSVFADHFHTNISAGEMLHLYSIGKDFDPSNIIATNLDPQTGLVCSQILPDSGAYVLNPCAGKTAKDIENFFKNSFVYGKVATEKSVVWLATNDTGSKIYKQTERKLTASGLTVWPIKYTDLVPEETVVYQINNKPASVEFIKNLLDAREVTVPPPDIKIDSTRTDIIIILGKNIKADPVVTQPPGATPPPTKQSPPPPPSPTPPPPTTITPPPTLLPPQPEQHAN